MKVSRETNRIDETRLSIIRNRERERERETERQRQRQREGEK